MGRSRAHPHHYHHQCQTGGSDEPDASDASELSEFVRRIRHYGSNSAEGTWLPYFVGFFGPNVDDEDGGGESRELGLVIVVGVGGSPSAAWYHRTSGRPRALADILQLRPEAHARLRVYSRPTGGRWRLGHGGARRTRLAVRTIVFAWAIYASFSPHGGEYRWPARGARAVDGRAGFRL